MSLVSTTLTELCAILSASTVRPSLAPLPSPHNRGGQGAAGRPTHTVRELDKRATPPDRHQSTVIPLPRHLDQHPSFRHLPGEPNLKFAFAFTANSTQYFHAEHCAKVPGNRRHPKRSKLVEVVIAQDSKLIALTQVTFVFPKLPNTLPVVPSRTVTSPKRNKGSLDHCHFPFPPVRTQRHLGPLTALVPSSQTTRPY